MVSLLTTPYFSDQICIVNDKNNRASLALADAENNSDAPVMTREGGQLLQDAQVSSFGKKQKIQNMDEVSACLCRQSAVPGVATTSGSGIKSDAVCC